MNDDTETICIWRTRIGGRQCQESAGDDVLCSRHRGAVERRLPGAARYGRTIVGGALLILLLLMIWSLGMRG